MTSEAKWIKVGKVGVDAGLLMIGDPCYFIGEKTSSDEAFPTWKGFLKDQRATGKEYKLRHQIDYAMGHAGLGVVAGTGGDGVFDVYALKSDRSDRAEAMLVITGDMEPPV